MTDEEIESEISFWTNFFIVSMIDCREALGTGDTARVSDQMKFAAESAAIVMMLKGMQS